VKSYVNGRANGASLCGLTTRCMLGKRWLGDGRSAMGDGRLRNLFFACRVSHMSSFVTRDRFAERPGAVTPIAHRPSPIAGV